MRACPLPYLPGTGALAVGAEGSECCLIPLPVPAHIPTPQHPYSQVHLLPGEWVGEVFHLVVTVLRNSGFQG